MSQINTLKPLSAQDALDKFYLEARARLLELAATLDRIDRGQPNPSDSRLQLLKKAIAQLNESTSSTSNDRAEQLQLLFSLGYDSIWLTTFQRTR